MTCCSESGDSQAHARARGAPAGIRKTAQTGRMQARAHGSCGHATKQASSKRQSLAQGRRQDIQHAPGKSTSVLRLSTPPSVAAPCRQCLEDFASLWDVVPVSKKKNQIPAKTRDLRMLHGGPRNSYKAL